MGNVGFRELTEAQQVLLKLYEVQDDTEESYAKHLENIGTIYASAQTQIGETRDQIIRLIQSVRNILRNILGQ